jgi:hypothetical protein
MICENFVRMHNSTHFVQQANKPSSGVLDIKKTLMLFIGNLKSKGYHFHFLWPGFGRHHQCHSRIVNFGANFVLLSG